MALRFEPLSKGTSENDKLNPFLRDLTSSQLRGKGVQPIQISQALRRILFGPEANGWISLVVKSKAATLADPTKFIIEIGKVGEEHYLRMPLGQLSALAGQARIERIDPIPMSRLTAPPVSRTRPGSKSATFPRGTALGHSVGFPSVDALGPDGKGVAIGFIDTGIDWRHPDFIDGAGHTRILALYDLYDDSWKSSHGKIGSEPPFHDEQGPVGTVYSNDQINAALRGEGIVRSTDTDGHGTMVAGTATGNGRAAGAEHGSYAGMAPQASLIVIRAGKDEDVLGQFGLLAKWIAVMAAQHKLPVVINISAGTQMSAHDGQDPQEIALNQLLATHPGVAVVVAAGNDRQLPLHTSGTFSPKGTKLAEIPANSFEIGTDATGEPAQATGMMYFDHRDDWGIAVAGFPLSADGTGSAATVHVAKVGGRLAYGVQGEAGPSAAQLKSLRSHFKARLSAAGLDELLIQLPPRKYELIAYGSGPEVVSGKYSYYASPGGFLVTRGAKSEELVLSPGNAAGVISVAAYYARDTWASPSGGVSHAKVPLGEIALFSSPGFRRDGFVKPDCAAPGSYVISPLAMGSTVAREAVRSEGVSLAGDGRYVSWQGTSAAAPYIAGIAARILQKNPLLSAKEIKQHVMGLCKSDSLVGKVPNRLYGMGKIELPARTSAGH